MPLNRRSPIEIGAEMKRAVAGEGRDLSVEFIDRFLQGHDAEGVLLGLSFVQSCRIEIADAEGAGDGAASLLKNAWPGLFGNLETVGGVAEDRGDPRSLVEQGRRVAEEITLPRAVVDRVAARGRIFDAEIAGEGAAGDEILRAANAAAVFEAWRQRAEASAIHADTAALFERGAAFGLDIHDTGGAKTELRGQRAGDQREIADKAAVQDVAETGDTVRQRDAVDAILHIAMLVAHVDVAAGSRILSHARRLQQHFVDRSFGALRQAFDGRPIHGEAADAEPR